MGGGGLVERSDPRIRQIRRLLAELTSDSAGAVGSTQSHWDLPVLPPPDSEGRLSSTDLLTWWFRSKQAGGNGATGWDDYFADGESEEPAEVEEEPAQPAGPTEAPPARRSRSRFTIASLLPEPEEPLGEAQAQAAVDCLYDFVHAFGRREVDAAMSTISESYHAIENDREIDRLRFRHILEAGLDSMRGQEIEVSLGMAPEALAHPSGVLIDTLIQIDTYSPADDSRGCLVERRVALVCEEDGGEWRIRGFGRVELGTR